LSQRGPLAIFRKISFAIQDTANDVRDTSGGQGTVTQPE
jgi:hypothetical protein